MIRLAVLSFVILLTSVVCSRADTVCVANNLAPCAAELLTAAWVSPATFVNNAPAIQQEVGGFSAPLVTCFQTIEQIQNAEAARLQPAVEKLNDALVARGERPCCTELHQQLISAIGYAREARIARLGILAPASLPGTPDYQMQMQWIQALLTMRDTACATGSPACQLANQQIQALPGAMQKDLQARVQMQCHL